MDDNNLNHLIAVNVLVPRLSVCEAERDEARRERDAYRKSWEREAQDAARYRLHHEACVTQRDEARKAAAGWVEDVSTMAARVDDMAGDLRACRAALDWYAKEDRYDVGRASRRPVVLADRGLLARRALAALSGVIPAPSDGMTLLDQTRLLLVGEKEHAIHWREYAAQVQDDRHRLAEALRWLLTSATSGPLRTAGPAQFYDAQVGLHAVEKARAALALYQDVGQDAEEQERRYERMMRERGFVSAADLCDPDWDEPSDGDTEETT